MNTDDDQTVAFFLDLVRRCRATPPDPPRPTSSARPGLAHRPTTPGVQHRKLRAPTPRPRTGVCGIMTAPNAAANVAANGTARQNRR